MQCVGELAAAYSERLREPPLDELVELPPDAPDGSHAWHLYIIRLVLDRLRVDRAQVFDALKSRGIGTKRAFHPVAPSPVLPTSVGVFRRDLPVATREYPRVLSLPMWPGMSIADVERVVGACAPILFARRHVTGPYREGHNHLRPMTPSARPPE